MRRDINLKDITFVISFIFCITLGHSQAIFEKLYGSSKFSTCNSIFADSSGFIIAGSTSEYGQGGQDILLMKTDLNGNIIWAKTIGGKGNDFANTIKKTSDNGYIIAGSTSSYGNVIGDTNFYIVKTNDSGTVQWTRTIGSTKAEVANDIIETIDHKYAVVGTTKSFGPGVQNVYLMELDSTGVFLWGYGMGSTGVDKGNSLIQGSNHGFCIVGSTTGFSSSGQIPYLINTNDSGIVQTSYTFNLNTSRVTNKRYFTKIIQGYSSDFVITGSDGLGTIGDAQHLLLSITQNTAVRWMYEYTLNTGEGVGTSVEKTPWGGYIIGGTMGIDIPALIKTDSVGGMIFNQIFLSSTGHGKGLDVKPTTDGDLILGGYYYASSDTAICLVKADTSLIDRTCGDINHMMYTPTTITPTLDSQMTLLDTGALFIIKDSGIVENIHPVINTQCTSEGIEEYHSSAEGVYVCQSNNSIAFHLINESEVIKLAIVYNVLGQVINTTGDKDPIIATIGFAKGIYYYKLLTNKGEYYTGKFIIL